MTTTTMNLNDRLYTHDEHGTQTSTQACLLIQFVLISSGRMQNTTPEMRATAAAIVEDVIEAALGSGRPMPGFPDAPPPLFSETEYCLLDWVEHVCSAAGADVVQEIIYGPLGKAGAKIVPLYLQ